MSSTSSDNLSIEPQSEEALSDHDKNVLERFKSFSFSNESVVAMIRDKLKDHSETCAMIAKLYESLKKEVRSMRRNIAEEVSQLEKTECVGNEILDLNFKRFLVLMCGEIHKFIITTNNFFLAEHENLQEDYVHVWTLGYQISVILDTVQSIDFSSFSLVFPLFKHLNNVSNGNRYLLAKHVWKIVCAPCDGFFDPDISKYQLIVIQALPDPVCFFDPELNKIQEGEETDAKPKEIKLSADKCRSFFAGHMTPENWITSKSALFRGFEISSPGSEQPSKVLLDLITYTVLLMYDINQEKGHYGGFNNMLIRRSDYVIVPDFKSILEDKEKWVKKSPNMKETILEELKKISITRIKSISCELFIEKTKIYNFLSLMSIFCLNIQKIEEKETEAYMKFLEQNPEIEKLTNHFSQQKIIE